MPKILIIEDDPKLKEALAIKLEKSGFEVISVGDGSPGITEALQDKPDLITLDLLMPEMSGETVLKRLKGSPETKDIPVVIISAIPPEVPEKLHSGDVYKTAAAYFDKDKVTLEEVVRKIKETLGKVK